jgi:hypothetical protein
LDADGRKPREWLAERGYSDGAAFGLELRFGAERPGRGGGVPRTTYRLGAPGIPEKDRDSVFERFKQTDVAIFVLLPAPNSP